MNDRAVFARALTDCKPMMTLYGSHGRGKEGEITARAKSSITLSNNAVIKQT